MPLSDAELAEVRDWVGDTTPPTDLDLDDIYDRLDIPTPAGVAYAVLTKRLAGFLTDPASYTIEGVYQESAQANITGLNSLLNDLAKIKRQEENAADPTTGPSTVQVARIVRAGWSR
jgi:hypothetical protein